jgi:ureidoglycolate amidohydrolase
MSIDCRPDRVAQEDARIKRMTMRSMKSLAIDSTRLQRWIDELAAISEATPPVVTRVLFSEADLAARAWVKQRFAEEGLAIREDAVGNIFARWQGTLDDGASASATASASAQPGAAGAAAAAAVATGSHIDAIPNAGRFDGVVGVLGALEAFSALRRAGFQPRRALELIVFTAEEPTRFGIGCLGSRLLSGALSAERAAALADSDGRTLEDWREAAGLRGGSGGSGPGGGSDSSSGLAGVRLASGHYAAFVELHIEQGPLLERRGVPIGIVTAIAGPSSYRVQLTGEGGHAGAVLMPDRHDAGLAGAEIALAVERAARSSASADTVGTTGVFKQLPNAINSIPCDVTLEIDFRDTRLDTRTAAWTEVERAIADICTRRGVRWTLETLNANPPAACAPAVVDTITRVCASLGLSADRMVSRAYHDSLFMAQICPTSMIFVPCRDGVSHRPDEYSSPEQIVAGVTVLAHTLAELSTCD